MKKWAWIAVIGLIVCMLFNGMLLYGMAHYPNVVYILLVVACGWRMYQAMCKMGNVRFMQYIILALMPIVGWLVGTNLVRQGVGFLGTTITMSGVQLALSYVLTMLDARSDKHMQL